MKPFLIRWNGAGQPERIGFVHGQTRRPTYAECEMLLAQMTEARASCIVWYLNGVHANTHTNIRRCECGEVAVDSLCCRLCFTLAQLIVSQDPDCEDDKYARYVAAERMLDRVATVVALLKQQHSPP